MDGAPNIKRIEQPGWYILFFEDNDVVGPVYSEYRVDTIKILRKIKKYMYDTDKENLIRTYNRNKNII